MNHLSISVCPNSASKLLTYSSISSFTIPLPPTSLRAYYIPKPSIRLLAPSPLSHRCPPLASPRDTHSGRVMAQTSSGEKKADEWGGVFEWEIKGAGEEEVWAVTGDFVGVQKWAPNLLKSSELVEGELQKAGCVRKCVLYPEPCTELYEKLLSMDEPLHRYKYAILEDGSTTPGFSLMRDYVGTFKLSPLRINGQAVAGTLLRWSYTCRPVSTMSQEDAHTTVFSLFQGAVDALKGRLSLPDDAITLVSKSVS